MKCPQTFGHLNKGLPYFRLGKICVVFDVLIYFFLNVPGISEFHYDTQALSGVIEERLFVVNNIRV